MVPFAGFEMPVQYDGIIAEHMAVREHAGLFDVSHMGEVIVAGEHAHDFVQHLVTNDIDRLEDGKALYTVMCREDGGIVDDLLVYRLASDNYMLVINAANIAGDFEWMRDHNPMGAELTDRSDEIGLLALQGPAAYDVLESATGLDIRDVKFYHFVQPDAGAFLGLEDVIVSRTGYTGEPGVEIYCRAADAPAIWDALMESGRAYGLQPAGLGARDTLRLEAGFCLYGNDITTETNPIEAGLGWLTKFDKDDFVGKATLETVKKDGPERRLVAFVAGGRGIPRQGHDILDPDGERIGIVTSGTQSPVLETGIGMGYVPNEPRYTTPGSRLLVSRRGRSFDVEVRRPPLHTDKK
jgi:aminomethyltransferase